MKENRVKLQEKNKSEIRNSSRFIVPHKKKGTILSTLEIDKGFHSFCIPT